MPKFFWIMNIIPQLLLLQRPGNTKKVLCNFPLEDNYELCTSLSICILLKVNLSLVHIVLFSVLVPGFNFK